MKRDSKRLKTVVTVVALYGLLAACTTWQNIARNITGPPPPNRGIWADHELHADEGLECSDCHEVEAGSRVTFASHELCSMCHDIPDDALTDRLTYASEVSCQKCHWRDDFSVRPARQLVTDEVKFDHHVHATAEVSCKTCHEIRTGMRSNTVH